MLYAYCTSDLRYMKVGYTQNQDPNARMKSVQTGCPIPLWLLAWREGSTHDERFVHAALGSPTCGEWFEVTHHALQILLYHEFTLTERAKNRFPAVISPEPIERFPFRDPDLTRGDPKPTVLWLIQWESGELQLAIADSEARLLELLDEVEEVDFARWRPLHCEVLLQGWKPPTTHLDEDPAEDLCFHWIDFDACDSAMAHTREILAACSTDSGWRDAKDLRVDPVFGISRLSAAPEVAAKKVMGEEREQVKGHNAK